MPAPERFAAEAYSFERWVRCGTDSGEIAARNALVHISRLFSAALLLPPPWNELLADQPEVEWLDEADYRAAVSSLTGRLPGSPYGMVFAPWEAPPGEAMHGLLIDDIGDIYRDVVRGLRAYQSGRRAAAVWEWGFHFRHHWGDHATNAIRALHAWLTENALELLSPPVRPPV